jgi:hypothetical protein
VIDLDTAFGQQLLHIAVRQAVAMYQRTATMTTSAGNRKPPKAKRGSNHGPGRADSFTGQACLDPSRRQRNSTSWIELLSRVCCSRQSQRSRYRAVSLQDIVELGSSAVGSVCHRSHDHGGAGSAPGKAMRTLARWHGRAKVSSCTVTGEVANTLAGDVDCGDEPLAGSKYPCTG